MASSANEKLSCPVGTRRLFLLAPILALVLTYTSYWMARPYIPGHVAIHMGPDGVGYGSAFRMLVVCSVIATAAFVVGGITAREFFVAGHWYQVEKAIVISVEAFAYAVLGVGLGSVLSTLGVESNGTSSQSVGLGLLSFVIVLILASIIYVVALPKGQFEELQARQ